MRHQLWKSLLVLLPELVELLAALTWDEWINGFRHRAGLSIQDLSERMGEGFSKSNAHDYTRGKTYPYKPDRAKALAGALDVDDTLVLARAICEHHGWPLTPEIILHSAALLDAEDAKEVSP